MNEYPFFWLVNQNKKLHVRLLNAVNLNNNTEAIVGKPILETASLIIVQC